VITTGGKLRAKYVIHAVGPRFGEGDEDRKLASATLNSLKVAEKNGLKSIAFPAISTGVFRLPVDRCANIMLSTVASYLNGSTELEKVIFYLYDSNTYEVFHRRLNDLIQEDKHQTLPF